MPMIYVKPRTSRVYGSGAYRKVASGRGSYSVKGRGAYRKVAGRGSYKVSGRGSYTPWADAGAHVGRFLGGGIGKWFGSGAYQRRATGRGAYKVRGRGAYQIGETMAPEIPQFENGGDDDSIIVTHKEYITDIVSSSVANTFRSDVFDINPGNGKTFPWLATLAQGTFGQYKSLGCIFCFQSSSAEALNSTNTALGYVIGAVNYDSNDAPFTSRMAMENCSWSQSGKPSNSINFGVETAKNMTASGGLLTVSQNGALPSGASKNEYNLGKFTIATGGMQGTNVLIGSLYVTYKFKLLKPIMLNPLSMAHRSDALRTGTTSAAPLGTATSLLTNSCDTIGLTFTNTTITMNRLRLTVGMRFVLIVDYVVALGAITVPGIALSSGLAGRAGYGSGLLGGGKDAPNPAVVDFSALQVRTFEVVDITVDPVITFSGAIFTAGGSPTTTIQFIQENGTPLNLIGIVS